VQISLSGYCNITGFSASLHHERFRGPLCSECLLGQKFYHFAILFYHILNLAITKGVRDYIHVLDLADGHSAAVQKLEQSPGLKVVGIYL